MDFTRAELTCKKLNFPSAFSCLQNEAFFVHSTCFTHNAPYVHPRLGSSLELCQTFPNEPVGSFDLFRSDTNIRTPDALLFRYVCSEIFIFMV